MPIRIPIFLMLLSCPLLKSYNTIGQPAHDFYPKQSIYLHTDKQKYLPGETIWFKAYLKAGYFSENISTTLFTNLTDGNGKLLSSGMWPILNATARGSMKLPDSIPPSGLFISPYTKKMLFENDDTAFTWQISIIDHTPVFNDFQSESLLFYPEGGSVVTDASNIIAFKFETSSKLPVTKAIIIKNGKGTITDSINSSPKGMGIFKIAPETDENFFAEWNDNNGRLRQTTLPVSTKEGVALHLEELNGQLNYIVEMPGESKMDTLLVVALQWPDTVYRARLDMSTISVRAGRIPIKGLPPGFLHLVVLNKEGKKLAQRKFFVNPEETRSTAMVKMTKKDLSPKGLNTVEISIPNDLQTDLSLSVFDYSFEDAISQHNIYSDLLLPATEFGYISNPAGHMNLDTKEDKKLLDLLVLTSPTRNETNKQQKLTDNSFETEDHIEVSGLMTDDKNRPLPNEEFTIIAEMPDSSRNWYQLKTDNVGSFHLPGLIFSDSANLFFKLKNIKKSSPSIRVDLAKTPTPKVNLLPAYKMLATDSVNQIAADAQLHIEKFKSGQIKTVELENVTVQGSRWRSDPMLKIDEKYTTGYFRGGATAYAFDVANDDMAGSKFDIYNYLLGKIPTLRIKYNGAIKSFASDYVFFLNESQVEAIVIDQLNLNAIAYIKYFYRFGALPGMPEAICVYLKNAADLKNELKALPGNLLKQKIYGYSSEKTFWEPDYKNKKTDTTDLRTTVLWAPYIMLNKAQPKTTITFYNNDVSKKLKLVLEGIDEEGKLIRVVQVIE